MEVKEFVKKKVNTKSKEEVEQMIKKIRKENDKLVKGKFEFIDAQGGWIEFMWRQLPGDPLLKIKIHHGEITELPLGIVKHLNNTVKKVRRLDENALKTKDRVAPFIFETQSRLKFTPMELIL